MKELLYALDIFAHSLCFLHELFENAVPFLVGLSALSAFCIVLFLQMVQLCLVLFGFFFSEQAVDFKIVDFLGDLAQHSLQLFFFDSPIPLFLFQDANFIGQVFTRNDFYLLPFTS